MRLLGLSLVLITLVAACRPEPLEDENFVTTGAELYRVDFEDDGAVLSVGEFPEAGGSIRLQEGAYWIELASTDAQYLWGQGGAPARDVVIEVESNPQSSFENDMYGILCRLNAEGEGYAFLISSDGFGAIASTERNRLNYLVEWREYAAIEGGQNTIRAVCVGDYLALSVNGELLADVRDSTFSDAGEVGLVAGVLPEFGSSEAEQISVSFDNLVVNAASVGD